MCTICLCAYNVYNMFIYIFIQRRKRYTLYCDEPLIRDYTDHANKCLLEPEATQMNSKGEIQCYFDSNWHPQEISANKSGSKYDFISCRKQIHEQMLPPLQKKLFEKYKDKKIVQQKIPDFRAYEPDNRTPITATYMQSDKQLPFDISPIFKYLAVLKNSKLFFVTNKRNHTLEGKFDFCKSEWTTAHYAELKKFSKDYYQTFVTFKQQQHLHLYPYFHYGYAYLPNTKLIKVCSIYVICIQCLLQIV